MIATVSRRASRISSFVALASLLTLAACGGAAPSSSEAAKSPEPAQRTVEATDSAPTSIEEAEKAIARAKAQLASAGAAAGAGAADAAPRPATPAAPVPAEPAPPTVDVPQTSSPTSSSKRPAMPSAPPKSALAAEDRCVSPCRAIASMRRAVTALCRMTGNDDTRCVDAKRTLVDSESRVSACSC